MANALYPIGKKALLDGDIDLLVNDIKVVLVDDTYTYSTAHDFLADVTGTVATSPNLGSKTTTGGTFDSADTAFAAVTGNEGVALILYQDTGNSATSRLIAYYDTGVTGLPVTPNGGDIDVTVNASGWFSI